MSAAQTLMCHRTYNPLTVRKTVDKYANQTVGFVPEVWLADRRNIALVNDNGDIGLMEYDKDGVYFGHEFFNSRGKDALKAAREMIETFFTEHPVLVIQGLTPIERKGARWLNRQIGFTSHRIIDTDLEGPCELFILTKEAFMEKDK